MDINPGASGSGSSGRLNSFSNGSDASLNSAEREKSEESAARRFIDQLNSSNADRVSLSYKSRQLHSIQAEFFFWIFLTLFKQQDTNSFRSDS